MWTDVFSWTGTTVVNWGLHKGLGTPWMTKRPCQVQLISISYVLLSYWRTAGACRRSGGLTFGSSPRRLELVRRAVSVEFMVGSMARDQWQHKWAVWHRTSGNMWAVWHRTSCNISGQYGTGPVATLVGSIGTGPVATLVGSVAHDQWQHKWAVWYRISGNISGQYRHRTSGNISGQ